MSETPDANELRERNLAILYARLDGATFRAIAEEHQISLERARLVFGREARRMGIVETSKRKSPRHVKV